MTWFLYHTAKNPQWIANVQNEVDEVRLMHMISFFLIRKCSHVSYKVILQILKGKDFPEYDDLSRMTVLDMAIKESMRMTPVTPGGSRKHDLINFL
jgi:cytochrome P450